MQYAWDFILAEGDTVHQKHDNLFQHIITMCVRPVDSPKTAKVTARKVMLYSLIVCADIRKDSNFEMAPQDGDSFMGEVKRDCGGNGYHANFELYSDPDCPEDEITIEVGDDKSVIKIFNYPS